MDYVFWIWLGVFVVTFILEVATAELVSIWFTIGSIIPMILAATEAASWGVQILLFFLVSAFLILSLRGVTKKYITKNLTEKTNLEALIGKRYHLQTRTDDETLGTLKIYGVTWNVIEKDGNTVEAGEIVEVVGVQGNKLIVVKVEKEKQPENESETEEAVAKKVEKSTKKKGKKEEDSQKEEE